MTASPQQSPNTNEERIDVIPPSPQDPPKNKPPGELSIETLQQVAVMPTLRQEYGGWYIQTYTGSSTFYINYYGSEGASINIQKAPLLQVLESVERTDDKKRKSFFQFQSFNEDYILRFLNNRKSSSNSDRVVYRFLRVNYNTRVAVLFQNTLSVSSRSTKMEKIIESFAIVMSVENFLAPLKHLKSPSINVTPQENITFENDI